MITCPKCHKENQDHYKFCLGCGAELPRDVAPKKFSPGTPPQGVPARGPAIADEPTALGTGIGGAAQGQPVQGTRPAAQPAAAAFQAPQAPAQAAPAASAGGGPPVICPQCETPNPGSNKFCASCGFKLTRPVSMPSPAAAPAHAPAAHAAAPATAVVLTALRADGSEAGSYPLPSAMSTIGRDTGSVFAGDSYLSPRHATFSIRGAKLFVRDESSLNGVYRKLEREQPQPVASGDVFRIGQEILRIEPLAPMPASKDGVERLGSPSKGYVGRVALVVGRDSTGNAYPIPETGLHLGRERGDVLFPEDGYVSGLHCRIDVQGSHLSITDLGSSNGSFVRISAETELKNGDILLMGQQLFRINM